MNNEDIIKYCITSPENINPAVLRSMLNSVEGGGGNAPIVYTYVGTYTGSNPVPFSYNDVKTAILGGNRVFFHIIDNESSVESWAEILYFFEQESGGQMSYGADTNNVQFVSTDPDEDMTWF